MGTISMSFPIPKNEISRAGYLPYLTCMSILTVHKKKTNQSILHIPENPDLLSAPPNPHP